MQMSFRFGPVCGAADVRQLSDNANVPCPECNPKAEPVPDLEEETLGGCVRCDGIRWIDPGLEWFWATRKVADEFDKKGVVSEKTWAEFRAVTNLFEKKEGQS